MKYKLYLICSGGGDLRRLNDRKQNYVKTVQAYKNRKGTIEVDEIGFQISVRGVHIRNESCNAEDITRNLQIHIVTGKSIEHALPRKTP